MAFFGVGGGGGGGRYGGGAGGYRHAYARPEEEEEEGPGFLSTGIGPDIGLGGITTLKEIGGGLTGLARLAMPGSKAGEPGWAEAGKGFASSLMGTAATIAKPFGLGFGDRPIEALGANLLGEEYRPKDFVEKVKERGLISALVEDVGNVAIAGAAVRAPISIGGAAARSSGNVTRAAQLSARAARLDPIVYPYRTAMRTQVRPRLRGAQERYLEAHGGARRAVEPELAPNPGPVTNAARLATRAETMAAQAEKRAARLRQAAAAGPPSERLTTVAARADEMAAQRRAAAAEAKAAAEEAAGQKPIARDADVDSSAGQVLQKSKLRERIREASQGIRNVEGIPGITLRTRMAATAANWMDTSELVRRTHSERRMLEAARRSITRAPGYQRALGTAEQFLVRSGVSPQEASNIVGDEVYARISGIHQLAEDLGGPQIHELLQRSGFRKHLAPKDVRGNAEWEQALADVTAEMKTAHAQAFETLTQGRKEFEGLERAGIDATELLPAQERQLARAAKERLDAARLQNKVDKQRTIQEGRIAQAEDRIGRQAETLAKLDAAREGALAAFDETRQYIAPAFDKARRAATYEAIIDRTRTSWEASGQQFGGATFNPHTGALFDPHARPGGRFIDEGEEVYAIGVVNDTAVKVPLDELAPEHIDRVVRAFQDLYENPEIMIGTWVDAEGMVHIDPSQVVGSRDRALTLAAARGQEAIWDNAGMAEVTPYLNTRQDVAARFVAQDKYRSARAAELRGAARSDAHNLTDADIDKFMALDDLIATSAWEKGLYSHPDEWYKAKGYQIKKGRRYLRRGVVEQALTQTYLKRDYNQRLWDDVTKYLGPRQLEDAMGWYHRSHRWVRDRFAGKEITLADGQVRPADEIFFQLLAVTSVQASPTTNLGNALKATANINRFMELPEFQSLRNQWATTLSRAADEGWTRSEVMAALFPEAVAEKSSKARKKAILESDLGEPLTGSKRGTDAASAARARGEVYKGMAGLNSHMYDFAKTLVHEILTGNTMDKWNAGTINEITRAWTGQSKFTDQAFAKLVERFDGDDIAAMEHFGGDLWAKLRSFHSNLSDPANSNLATLDSWMARLLDLPNWDTPGTYATFAGKLRDMAAYASEQMGRTVRPHEVQAALWAYSKLEIGRQNWGRLMGFASDTLHRLDQGTWSAVDDPTSVYFMEDITGSEVARARVATTTEAGFQVEERPIRRLDVRPEEIPTEAAARNELKRRVMEEEGIEGTRGRLISDAALRAAVDRRFRRRLQEAPVRRETQYKAYPTRLEGEIVTEAGETKRVLKSEESLARYQKVQRDMATAIDRGDIDGARDIYMRWVNSQRKTILDEEWGDFNDVAAKTGAADLQGAMEAVREQGLMQSFERQILGTMQSTETRYLIRLYKDADFTTLVHENAHVLRQILPDHQVGILQHTYGITNGRWTAANEERFADEFMSYLASDGRVAANAELADVFANVRRHLSEYWDGAASHIVAGEINPTVARLFDEWLAPAKVARPEGIIGVAQRAPEVGTPAQLGMRAPDIPLGTPKEAFRRGARGQKALRDLERLEARRSKVANAKAQMERNVTELRRVIDEKALPAEVAQRRLQESAARRLEGIEEGLGQPRPSQVPRAWAPIWEAVKGLQDEVDRIPELAQVIDGRLPQTFDDVVRFAYDNGFRPEHVRDFRPDQVQRLVFETLRIGRPALGDIGEEVTAGTRRRSYGVLRKTNEVDRSLESLIAGSIEAMHETHTNSLVTWIESNLARRVPETGQIPRGWDAWDPQRHLLMTGEVLPSGATQALTGTQFMIPSASARQLRNMSKNYGHWALEMVGKPIKPWRAWILSLNPRYYMNNFVGNMVLAAHAGALNPADWAQAWQQYRGTKIAGRTVRFPDVPIGGEDITRVHGIRAKAGGTHVRPTQGRRADLGLLRRGGGGPMGRASEALNRLNRINESADAFARSAVYFSRKRKGFSDEAAVNTAYEAMVDYGSLSPFERQMVRTIVPFYAWQRGILKIAMKMPFDHPARVAFLMSMSQFNDDAAMDLLGLTDPSQLPQDYRHVLDLPGTQNYLSVKQLNPFGDAHQLLTPQGIAQSLNPIAEAIMRKGLGAPEGGYAESYRMNAWGGAEPDTDLAGDIVENMAMSGPTAALLQATGRTEGIGGRPVGETSVLRWAGAPVMPAEQVERGRKRIRKTVARMEGRSLAGEEEAAGPRFFGGAGGRRKAPAGFF